MAVAEMGRQRNVLFRGDAQTRVDENLEIRRLGADRVRRMGHSGDRAAFKPDSVLFPAARGALALDFQLPQGKAHLFPQRL
ncbi:hypothetical protein HNP84_001229 [Thermocatellispora tengchongensis]|uniref:Uncharacterized protein n=1 Tax=Thermocatellispora tengchongensis TaxID=1073253 RepID=A0A840P0R1_9ACTN|nr:hypothetical protein [Thermocatellispora tengchongensis]MBB5131523.1 hypothetical protein [Thermocatellispora tengchongensis]